MDPELSWSRTPSKVWWALENGSASPSSTSLSLDSLRSPTSSLSRSMGGDSLRLDRSNVYYDYADETDYQEETEEELAEWLKDYRGRGVIRVFQPGTSYSELIKCDIDTTTETVVAKCLAKELYIHYGSKYVRRVRLDEHPLQLQLRFLQELGHCNPYRMQLEGLKGDLPHLFKFVAGQENGNRPEDKVQLVCALKVKELHTGLVSVWTRRFCVLCGSHLFIFAGSHPRGKPTLVLGLRGASMEEYKTKKYALCLKITTSRNMTLLSFESRLEQSKWLERAGKIISKHPLEANLAGFSLERVPKYYFLNYNIVALNLAHNFVIESFKYTDEAMLGHPKTIGWIDDIYIFHRLVSLSLSDNCLEQFPLSLCCMANLKELDLSCNTIKEIPPEIERMTKLTTLLLHSNKLTALPFELKELSQLSTLVIAFNRFFQLPDVIQDLPSLRIFIISGNYMSDLPQDINKVQSLQHFDIRFNKIKSHLPRTMQGIRNLTRLNVRGNGMNEISMADLLYLEFLNCSDNFLRSLALCEGPITNLIAKNNIITQFSVPATCEQLTSINISKNELTSLPESLVMLESLQKFNASNNKLTKLPSGIFKMKKLLHLCVSSNRLVTLPHKIAASCTLQTLDLHSNQLASLPADLLSKCTQLTVLNVSSNRLSSLPPVSSSSNEPHELQEFYAASNSLKDSCFSTLFRYRKLVILHLAYNGLRTIPPGFFSSLKDLEYLNLSGNSFSSLPPILGCPRLKCFLLHSNKIHTLPTLSPLHQLHTLDLSCNQFESVPSFASFPNLKFLDLSGNSSLAVTEEAVKTIRSSSISTCCLLGILDISEALTQDKTFETGGTTIHGRWSYGSSTIIGTKSENNCTVQLKAASMSGRGEDGVFAVMDGGRSPKAPVAIAEMLEKTLMQELMEEETEREEGFLNVDPLQYLTCTFLTLHRKLGEVGQEYGSSAVLGHIHMVRKGCYVLNVANTGLGEAILCRSGRAVPLTTPHSPATNVSERTRIAETRGFVSQDNRVNGVCSASRLLGVYHLWPQVIPIPSTETVELRTEDEYIVLATNTLWKHLTYEQIAQEVKSVSDPIQASKRLRDLAVAYGCSDDISVVVVKLRIDTGSRASMSSLKQVSVTTPKAVVEEEEEEEEPGVTNIDDPISDDEGTEKATIDLKLSKMVDTTAQDNIDRMVLGAIGSPLNSVHIDSRPTMQSTNFDDLPLSDVSPDRPTLVGSDSTPSELPERASRPNSHLHKLQQMQLQMEADYEAQTLPKIASQAKRKNSGLTPVDTSFEQTQSVPSLQLKWTLQNPQDQGLTDPVRNQLETLNEALNRIEEENGYSSVPYNVESIERPRRREKAGRVSQRLSYVEHAYSQLTNDTYSTVSNTSSSLGHVKPIHSLDTWVTQKNS